MGLVFVGILVFIASFIMAGLHRQTSERVNLRPLAWTARSIGALLIVIGILFGAVVMVPAGYRGVKLQFGAVAGTLPEGINFMMPGINSAILMEVRTQMEESTATAASKDLQIVSTQLALNFRIDPNQVPELYQKVGIGYKERIIAPAVQESIKVVTAKYTAEELIRSRAEAKAAVEEEITKRLAVYNIIVEPAGLSITNFDFSEEFNKAIEAKQVAQQEAEKQKYLLQRAELEKETEITRAEGAAQAAKLNAAALQVQGGQLVIAREWIQKWDGKLPQVNSGQQMIMDISRILQGSGTR